MDPRLEFAFQLLMDGTGLPRHEVMDHVFEGDMLDEINQLFLPHMRSTLVWYYQVTDEPEQQRPIDTVINTFRGYYIINARVFLLIRGRPSREVELGPLVIQPLISPRS